MEKRKPITEDEQRKISCTRLTDRKLAEIARTGNYGNDSIHIERCPNCQSRIESFKASATEN